MQGAPYNSTSRETIALASVKLPPTPTTDYFSLYSHQAYTFPPPTTVASAEHFTHVDLVVSGFVVEILNSFTGQLKFLVAPSLEHVQSPQVA